MNKICDKNDVKSSALDLGCGTGSLATFLHYKFKILHGVDISPEMLKKAINNLKIIDNIKHDENQYLNLLKDILEENQEFNGRNGKTLSIYGSAMHFSLENNVIPLLTTKRVAYKTCLRELLWFISCLLYTSPSPRDGLLSRMPSSA